MRQRTDTILSNDAGLPEPLSPKIIKTQTRNRRSGARLRPRPGRWRSATAIFRERIPACLRWSLAVTK